MAYHRQNASLVPIGHLYSTPLYLRTFNCKPSKKPPDRGAAKRSADGAMILRHTSEKIAAFGLTTSRKPWNDSNQRVRTTLKSWRRGMVGEGMRSGFRGVPLLADVSL